jgi:hypothetical protein
MDVLLKNLSEANRSEQYFLACGKASEHTPQMIAMLVIRLPE